MYKYELEKGSKKYLCPACNQKRFVRYVRTATNEHLDSAFGRCDRENSCGYHFTPKMYFAENPNLKPKRRNTRKARQGFTSRGDSNGSPVVGNTIRKFDSIPKDYLIQTLTNYQKNSFVQFLLNLFPDYFDEVQNAIKNYQVGTTKNGKTVFWQIDKRTRIRTGKIISYDAQTGKRRKHISPNWIHAELKKETLLKQDFKLKQCFFGEHLLRRYPNKNICIVEAEKTAIIASICLPEFVWLAIGSKQGLKLEKLRRLGRDKRIILYPDADGFDRWNKTTLLARRDGFDVSISKLIQTNADATERLNGSDLADYLIKEQTEVNKKKE